MNDRDGDMMGDDMLNKPSPATSGTEFWLRIAERIEKYRNENYGNSPALSDQAWEAILAALRSSPSAKGTDHSAASESATAKAPSMECGRETPEEERCDARAKATSAPPGDSFKPDDKPDAKDGRDRRIVNKGPAGPERRVTNGSARDASLSSTATPVDPESEAANPVWDLVIHTCAQAWPAGLLTWDQSPTELIVRIINERDEALEKAQSATLPKPDAVTLVGKKSIQLSYFGDVTPEQAKAAFDKWLA